MEMDLPRAARASRGKRMAKLVDEETEADEIFWNQDALIEDAVDNEYEEEEEQVDVFDSDFDEDVPESDNEEAEEDERKQVKKRRIFPGKMAFNEKKKGSKPIKRGMDVLEGAVAAATERDVEEVSKLSQPSSSTQKKIDFADVDNQEFLQDEGEKIVRKSSRMAVIVRQAERDALRAALQSTQKPVKKKKGNEEERRMTQEDMLLEAAQTEIMNLQSLEKMLAREEEVKKRAIIQKLLYTGPQIRFYSTGGKNVLEFTKVSTFPEVINSKAPTYPVRHVCVITGLPARYRDPLTGLPYATKEAFKMIRERYLRTDNHQASHVSFRKKRTEVEHEKSFSGRVGVVRLKFKKSPPPVSTAKSRQMARPLSHVSSATVQVIPPLVPTHQEGSKTQGFHRATSAATMPYPQLPVEEANEADFLLEDLEVVPPLNLDNGLSASSTAMPSFVMQNTVLSEELNTNDISLESGILGPSSPTTVFFGLFLHAFDNDQGIRHAVESKITLQTSGQNCWLKDLQGWFARLGLTIRPYTREFKAHAFLAYCDASPKKKLQYYIRDFNPRCIHAIQPYLCLHSMFPAQIRAIARIRMSSHCLMIEGRWLNIDEDQRICSCNEEIETEEHAIYFCHKHDTLRAKYSMIDWSIIYLWMCCFNTIPRSLI